MNYESTGGCPVHGGAGRPAAAMSPGERVVQEEGARLDFSAEMSYGDYLRLD